MFRKIVNEFWWVKNIHLVKGSFWINLCKKKYIRIPTHIGNEYKKYWKKVLEVLKLSNISKKIINKTVSANVKNLNLIKLNFSLFPYKIKQHNKAIMGINNGLKILLWISKRTLFCFLFFLNSFSSHKKLLSWCFG